MDGEDVGEEFAGYILKILGGQDKQGFAMKQGVLTQDRVKLMMSKGALTHLVGAQLRQGVSGRAVGSLLQRRQREACCRAGRAGGRPRLPSLAQLIAARAAEISAVS